MSGEEFKHEEQSLEQEVSSNAEADFESAEHEMVKKYKPKFLAEGGEHIVYEIEGHPDIVAKASSDVLRRVIQRNTEIGKPVDFINDDLRAAAQEYIATESARYREMGRYFGAEHVPAQREYLLKVPVTQEILLSIDSNYFNEALVSGGLWTVVRFQRRVEELMQKDRLALVAGYAEKNAENKADYQYLTEYLIFNNSAGRKFDQNTFCSVQKTEELNDLVAQIGEDHELRGVVAEFIEKATDYSNEVGEILDVVGRDNLIFFKKDGKWSYKLVDTKYSGQGNTIDRARITLARLQDGEEIDDDEKNHLANVFNYIRTINGLAELCGSKKRINIAPEGMDGSGVDFMELLKDSI